VAQRKNIIFTEFPAYVSVKTLFLRCKGCLGLFVGVFTSILIVMLWCFQVSFGILIACLQCSLGKVAKKGVVNSRLYVINSIELFGRSGEAFT